MASRDNFDNIFSKDKNPEIKSMDSWRVFRIIGEFVDGFEKLAQLGPSVSVFGSARTAPDSPYYELGKTLGKEISHRGFSIITGGGPGCMEAVNKGASKNGTNSCGLCVTLPYEDNCNAYIDPNWLFRFRYFFVRKVMFIRYASAYVFLPGGVGTLDELFEALTLIQTKKIQAFPIFLMGSDYWEGLLKWLKQTPLEKHGCISQEDIDRLQICDDPVEVAEKIKAHYEEVGKQDLLL